MVRPGAWTPTPTSYAYRWLRDGQPIPKADQPTYVAGLDDRGTEPLGPDRGQDEPEAARRERLQEALRDKLRPQADGSITLQARAWAVQGTEDARDCAGMLLSGSRGVSGGRRSGDGPAMAGKVPGLRQ